MVKNWYTEFCCGHTSTNDEECRGHPLEVLTPEKTYDMWLDDFFTHN